MPRRRPGHIRTSPPRRTPAPVIDGLSQRTLSEIRHLERTRNYLLTRDVGDAVRAWAHAAHDTHRQQWRTFEFGDTHEYCCDDPLEARALLADVVQALPPPAARELGKVIEGLDALWTPPEATLP